MLCKPFSAVHWPVQPVAVSIQLITKYYIQYKHKWFKMALEGKREQALDSCAG